MPSKPHSVEDNESPGKAVFAEPQVTNYLTKEVTILIGFDDTMLEFKLWDKLYDVESYHTFEMTSTTDFEKRIEFYVIKAQEEYMVKFIDWLKENEFTFSA